MPRQWRGHVAYAPETRPCLTDLGVRPGRKLTAGSGIAPKGGGHLPESQPERIMQEEGRPLQW